MMIPKQLLQSVAVALFVLLAGTLPTWAWNYSRESQTDAGGGTYNFRYTQQDFKYNGQTLTYSNMMDFRTLQHLNLDGGNSAWQFKFRVVFDKIAQKGSSEMKNVNLHGDIYFVNESGETIYFAEYNKILNHTDIGYGYKEYDYGNLAFSEEIDNTGNITVLFSPTSAFFNKGFKTILFRNRLTYKSSQVWEDYQYEKTVDISSWNTYMPTMYSMGWQTDGSILFGADGLRELSSDASCREQKYEYSLDYENRQSDWGRCYLYPNQSATYGLTKSTVVNGKYNVTFPYKCLSNEDSRLYPFTMPVVVNYQIEARYRPTPYLTQTYTHEMTPFVVVPYTRPETVTTEFDKWSQKVIVKWTRREKATYKNYSVDTKNDGRWYVIRYDKGADPDDYTLIGSMKGNNGNLQMSDADAEYGHDYIYRVVFLPDILEDGYAEKLTKMPRRAGEHSSYDLYEESTINTLLDVPIRLTQDRTYESGIKLSWEYNVQKSGCEWRIDKRRQDSETWTTLTTLPLDKNKSVATYEDNGDGGLLSPCDFYVYRIRTEVNGQEFFSEPLTANLPGSTYIKEVTATTGVHTDYVEVNWKVEQRGTDDTWFRVMRRPLGSTSDDDWVVLSSDKHGTASEYSFNDERVMAGSYYEYTVQAFGLRCDEQVVQTDQKTAPGFSQARGIITGHISYGTGTAVAGAKVSLVKSSADETGDTPQYLSRFIDGEGAGLTWKADAEKYKSELTSTKPFTLQLWAKPQTGTANSRQSLLRLNAAMELVLETDDGEDYYLSVEDMSQYHNYPTSHPMRNLTLGTDRFTHIAVVCTNDTWTFYVGNDTLRSASIAPQSPYIKIIRSDADYTMTIGGSNRLSNCNAYQGFVDDVRLWKRALSREEIKKNYTRILGGTEKDLMLYWPMDEGINVRDYVFDVACEGNIYQLNHPTVGVNALPSGVVPDLLQLYGETDGEGDYIIRGIPFQEGGTNYKLVPALGIHEFSPNSRSMFVSPTSLTANNIDFEDVSSFPMEGYIYYAGTNIPADSVMLYIDGVAVTADGEVKMTNVNGYYQISVPIGEHYVEAKAQGHRLVDGGRFPAGGGKYNFNQKLTYNFTDSTLVNFVGRVGGGERNDTLAVGFGASKNNIGMATITLMLNNESFSFNCQDDHISTATANRVWESDTTGIASRSWTGTGYDAKYIYIRTDSLTGEFSALLPPLNYVTKSIQIDSNPDIEFFSLPNVDLTNAMKQLKDSLEVTQPGGEKVWEYYAYNTKMVRTYFAPPQISVTQKNNEPGAFGIQQLDNYRVDDGVSPQKMNITDIWKLEDGKVSYRFGYPLFEKGDYATFSIKAYESYVNRDAQALGKTVTETIPLSKQSITIKNEMSDKQSVVYKVTDPNSEYQPGTIYALTDDVVELGEDGSVDYTWRAGLPNIVSPYTRHFTITMERDERIYVPAEFDAVVLGDLPDGNNFVTKGPDNVDYVLRDPPGAKSKTTLKKGSYVVEQWFEEDGGYGDEKVVLDMLGGFEFENGAGVGFMVMTSSKAKVDIGVGTHIQWSNGDKHGHKWVTTTTEDISTGSAYPYVGSAGDVYIGTSSNLILGDTRDLCITRKTKDGPLELGVLEAMSLGSEVTSFFKYSQYELETVMIPKWKDLRNQFLTEVSDSVTAYNYVNNGDQSVYLTWLKPDNVNYGKTGYLQVPPQNVTKSESDTILFYNNQIDRWEDIIWKNEEDKVKCMENQQNFENFSIDGGSSYGYSYKTDSLQIKNSDTWTFKMGGVFNALTGYAVSTQKKFGLILNVATEHGGYITHTDEKDEGTTMEWDYSIVDGNRDTDLSINKYESKKFGYSDFFSIYGGQTYNPYEGQEVTHYYKPGTPLGNATVQMEQPDLQISLGDGAPGKNLTVTDVPSGQKLNLTLTCSNLGTAHQGKDFSFDLIYVEKTDTTGLQIFMDGYPMNGRSVYLPRSETIKKTLTINQTDESILNHEGIKIRFCSQYQPLKIYDEVTLNVHFAPSSSPVDLAIDTPVLNAEEMARNEGNLIMKLQNLNRQFKNLRYVGVQYRYANNPQWNTIHTYVTNAADSLNTSYSLLPESGVIRYAYNMLNDNLFPQGTYTFRAFTTTPYGNNPNDAATVYSPEVTVVKDNVSPRALTTPTPADGVLRYGDDLSVEFNEDIVPGYVSDKNVIVTAKLNHQPVDHEVSKLLFTDDQRTVNPVFLSGDFSFDFWMKWDYEGSLLHLGKGNTPFALSIDGSGHIIVNVAGTEFVSDASIPKMEWTYLVVSYRSTDMTFSALAQYGTTTLTLFSEQPVMPSAAQAITYTDDNHLYLGSAWAYMHDLCLYNIYRDVNDAASTKYQSKDTYVYGLKNYWPMNEGHGSVCADQRHTHDFEVFDYWEVDNTNYALYLMGEEGAQADISHITTSQGESYAIELWTENLTEHAGEQTIFQTGTTPANHLRLFYDTSSSLMLEYGEHSKLLYTLPNDNVFGWHHMALNVVRGQAASFYFDGQRTAVIAETDVPPIQGASMTLCKGIDCLDELRIWKAELSESRLLSNMYNCIDTADIYSRGLVAYYPFEKSRAGSTLNKVDYTLENMAPVALPGETQPPLTVIARYNVDHLYTPPLKSAPEETRLIANPVASERKVVVNLTGASISSRDIEGTTLNITLADIRDLHGNASEPIKWTAYVQQNTLKWMRDSVNIIKPYGDGYTFDVDIENRGGTTEYYTLYNMPQWLTLVDSERTDDIAPLKTKTLRFQVDPLAAVGNYDVTIGLQGNKEVLEPLRIVMKVSGQRPDWAVDPAKYEHQMTIIGQVYVNGILMENSESLVTAFIGDECRGVASPEKVRGAAYATLTLYGTDTAAKDGGKPLSFRIWDASKGVVYADATLTVDGTIAPVVFAQDQLIGNYDEPAIWQKSDKMDQQVPINENWNWVAFGVEPNPYLDVLFNAYKGWALLVKDHQGDVSYSNGSFWSGTLKPAVNTMYKVKVENPLGQTDPLPSHLLVTGHRSAQVDMPVLLVKDWNWVAYTPLNSMPIDMALAAANPQPGDIIKSQTGVAIYHSINGWEGNLKTLESGRGYMYFSTDDETKQFVYPDAPAAARRVVAEAADTAEPLKVFTPIDRHRYPNNMTMTVQLRDGAAVVDTAEVAVFIDGECRAAARSTGPLYFLVVPGEGAGMPMELRTCIGGQVITIDDSQQFVSDANIGTPWEPYVIDLQHLSTSITPLTADDDDADWYTLQGFRLPRKPQRPGVYIHRGTIVKI